jgi:hypothetical protein
VVVAVVVAAVDAAEKMGEEEDADRASAIRTEDKIQRYASW